MPKNYIKNYLHLHVIVFIWGFTAVLGALVQINAIPLVWYRVLLASIFLFLFLKWKRKSLVVSKQVLFRFAFGGILIGVHWVTFFHAVKVSNVSITLATMSTGALFTTILQVLLFKRRMIGYELVFGLLAIVGLFLIFNAKVDYTEGILYALISSFLSASFSILNSELVKTNDAVTISFYELMFATVLLTITLFFTSSFNGSLFKLTAADWVYLLILASICTAYAFAASTYVLKSVSAFTMMLTINLEPIYGILLALIVFGQKEVMGINFYLGASLILFTILLNGFIKYKPGLFQLKSR